MYTDSQKILNNKNYGHQLMLMPVRYMNEEHFLISWWERTLILQQASIQFHISATSKRVI